VAKFRVGIYARQSKTGERKGPATTWQLAECRRWCERNGHEVVAEYVDDTRSVYRKVVRPSFEQLLDDVWAGEFDAVKV